MSVFELLLSTPFHFDSFLFSSKKVLCHIAFSVSHSGLNDKEQCHLATEVLSGHATLRQAPQYEHILRVAHSPFFFVYFVCIRSGAGLNLLLKTHWLDVNSVTVKRRYAIAI